MSHKDIRQQINKQLKKQFPGWNKLPKKQKKEIARNTLAEVVADYDFNKPITASNAELLGIKQQLPTKGIIPLAEMAEFIKKIDQSRNIKFSSYKKPHRGQNHIGVKSLLDSCSGGGLGSGDPTDMFWQ